MPFHKKTRLTPRESRKDLDRLTKDFDKLAKSFTKARRPGRLIIQELLISLPDRLDVQV